MYPTVQIGETETRREGTRISCCLRTFPHYLPQGLKYHNYASSSGFSIGPPLYSLFLKDENRGVSFSLVLPSRLGGPGWGHEGIGTADVDQDQMWT